MYVKFSIKEDNLFIGRKNCNETCNIPRIFNQYHRNVRQILRLNKYPVKRIPADRFEKWTSPEKLVVPASRVTILRTNSTFSSYYSIINSLRNDERNAWFRRRGAIESSVTARPKLRNMHADRLVIERNEGPFSSHRHARRRRSRAHTLLCVRIASANCERELRVDLGGKRMSDTWPNH